MQSINTPPDYKWQLTITKDKYLKINMPTAPNWFHRKTQKLILGLEWTPITSEENP